MAPADLPAHDPYATVPSLWDRHGARITPAVAFLLTVVLAVMSFPPFKTPEFAYVCLVPGIFWAYLRPSFRLYAWTMGAAQALAWILILGWLRHVTWLGLFLLGPVVGCWIGSWYLAAWWTMPRMVNRPTPVRLMALLGLAGAWVVVEWTRTWVLGGFAWLPLAASQWQRASILQIAAYTGSGGVSFVLVAVNIGFAAYAHRLFREGETGLRKRSQEFFLAMFLLLVCLSVCVQEAINRRRFTVPFARVAFVQPDIPQEVKWDPAKGPGILDVLSRLTLRAGAWRPDLILWPESVMPLAVKGDPAARDYVERLSSKAGAPILFGSNAIEEGVTAEPRWYNAAFVVTPDLGLQAAYYAKQKLVPFGEFVPLRPLLGWLKKFVPIGEDDFSRGAGPSPLPVRLATGVAQFGVMICYEDTYPSVARGNALAGADALAVITNNAWFGEGGAAYQHAAHSVLRAVETRRPVLRCGNAGWSGWIDEFGGIRKEIVNTAGSIYFRGEATIDVTRDSRWIGQDSFYTRYGDWFVGVSFALAWLAWALLRLGGPPAPRIAATTAAASGDGDTPASFLRS